MMEAEKAEECRYGIFDVAYLSKEDHQKNKLAFIHWYVLEYYDLAFSVFVFF